MRRHSHFPILVGLAACPALMLAAVAAASPELARYEYAKVLMGVRMNVVLYATDDDAAEQAAAAAFDRITEVEQVASTFRPTSEVSRLCEHPLQGPIPVSEDLYRLVQQSQDLHERTGGAFDCTIGHLAELWGKAARGGPVPTRQHAESLRMIGESKDLVLDTDARTVELRESVNLDFNGIAKGYAGDEALKSLRARGVTIALIDLSGDIVAGDPPPGEMHWTVAMDLDDPVVPRVRLRLANAAVATSGDSQAHFVSGGVRYSHIIDPRSSMPCTTRSAACVIAPTGALADGLATAMCVLGPDDGPPIAATFEGVQTLIAAYDGPTHRVASTDGFDAQTLPLDGKTTNDSSE